MIFTYPSPLVQGKFIKRYNRFLVDVLLENGETVTAHCPNTGAMLGLLNGPNSVWLSHCENPNRKLGYTWEFTEIEGQIIGVNTQRPNQFIHNMLKLNHIPSILPGKIYPEKKYGQQNSRIDFLIEETDGPRHYVEVKNVHHMIEKDGKKIAIFPDSKTERGTKHLNELMNCVAQGHKASVIYAIQRDDCDYLDFGDKYDPLYANTARQAIQEGVQMIPITFSIKPSGVSVKNIIKVLGYDNLSE